MEQTSARGVGREGLDDTQLDSGAVAGVPLQRHTRVVSARCPLKSSPFTANLLS